MARISWEDHCLSKPKLPLVLKKRGVSQTLSTDFTPTPKRPIFPPRLADELMCKIVSTPCGETGEPVLAQYR